jgi:uncharacterized protein
VDDRYVLKGGTGLGIELATGTRLGVINRLGGQVVDMWAVVDDDEHLSMEHTRTALQRLVPRVGDDLYSTARRPLLTLIADSSPGVHDTLIAACDPERYRQLGGSPDHPSCAANFARILAEHGRQQRRVPSPLNLFMNIPWQPDGALSFEESPARPSDAVTFTALVDVLVVLSACPMDLNPINRGSVRDVDVRVHDVP